MSKTVAEWQLRATADGWKWNDIEHFWYNDKGERSLYHELEEIYTTPSPDVAGSDAVAFAEWCRQNYMTGDAHNYPSHKREDSWYRIIQHKGALPDEVVRFTTSQLYAKFREQHPQPAGASVDYKGLEELEQAAVKYANENHPYDTPRSVASLSAFYAGAAFQAAQGVEQDETLDLANKTIEVIYQLLCEDMPSGKILEKVELEIDRYHEYQLSHPLIESAPYLAPAAVSAGIPADLKEAIVSWFPETSELCKLVIELLNPVAVAMPSSEASLAVELAKKLQNKYDLYR